MECIFHYFEGQKLPNLWANMSDSDGFLNKSIEIQEQRNENIDPDA
jgi:hypothetical protein